ncbi:hypothetical protein [Nonomuraea basaltis]|nr:hypothetical protein [Nonomuraea basaltis]
MLLRLLCTVLSMKTAEQFCVGEHVTAQASGGHLILDLSSEGEEECPG